MNSIISILILITSFSTMQQNSLTMGCMPPYPLPYKEKQPDGTSIYLKLNGDLEFSYLTDENGYPVVEIEDSLSKSAWNVYASYNDITGQFDASNVAVGKIKDPSVMGFNKYAPSINSLTSPQSYIALKPSSLPFSNQTISSIYEEERWTRNSHKQSGIESYYFIKRTKFTKPGKRKLRGEDFHSRGELIHYGNEDKGKKKVPLLIHPFSTTNMRTLNDKTKEKVTVDIMKNLVVLLCFADHDISVLPSPDDYDTVFNKDGPSHLSLTGSVRDVYTTSSYGQLQIESVIYPWIQLSETESYYANENAGGSSKLHQALIEALSIIDADTDFQWQDFDRDGDKRIDSITFLHSGYGAEFGGHDCRRNKWKHRIWSHMWKMKSEWKSQRKQKRARIKVQQYQIASGLWGRDPQKCEYNVMHIGVISHEIAHFLGLDDQYGGPLGVGIGSYGLMGNAWGADFSQNYPPIMSPWNKIALGWIEPIELSESGVYEITASYKSPMIYKITDGFKDGEYLLIENRQPQLFDRAIPQGGLLIWHIDEQGSLDSDGYPDQIDWPENGNHYINALLQADGSYDLEMGVNYGDKFDAFHANGVPSIGPKGTPDEFYPNTDSYQNGKIKETGHIISDISASADVMSFRFINGIDQNDDYYDNGDEIGKGGKNKNKDKAPKDKKAKQRRRIRTNIEKHEI